MAVQHHSQLLCWQLASNFRKAVFEETANTVWKRDWKLCDDLRRAARSVPANIAEGFWRYHHPDFVRFLNIALGSLGESEDHLESAVAGRLITEDKRDQLRRLAIRTRVATQRLRKYLLTHKAPAAEAPQRTQNTR